MLYHFSEDPSICTFQPRPSNAYDHLKPAVWAIDAEHACHYYFLRDCPTVIYWKENWTSESDAAYFFSGSSADKIIVVESQWLERMRAVKLYRYTFPEDTFELFDKTAGYYISYQKVSPLEVERVEDVIQKLLIEGVEFRFTPNLYPINTWGIWIRCIKEMMSQKCWVCTRGPSVGIFGKESYRQGKLVGNGE